MAGSWRGNMPKPPPPACQPSPSVTDAGDQLDLDDAAIRHEARGPDRGPGRVGWFHEFADDLLERVELLVARAFEVRSLPDVEAVDHGHVLEVGARGFEDLAQALERAFGLQLEGRDVFALAFAAVHDDSRHVDHVADA